MKVELIDSMGNDLRVANAARVSFGKWKEEINESDANLIRYLAANEHSSPFRHTAITLRCSAPSRSRQTWVAGPVTFAHAPLRTLSTCGGSRWKRARRTRS